MQNELQVFEKNIEETRYISSLFDYLTNTVVSPMSFEDLLRSQIVYSVSAFDKLMHGIICKGMVETFIGTRIPTPKYLSEPITMATHFELITASLPPKEYLFEQAIVKKLKVVSYQEPGKVSDGLSYIWDEKQKWQKIATSMGMNEQDVRTTLKLIADRRNMIVHEADIDPSTSIKRPLSKTEAASTIDFLHECGLAITAQVQ